MSKLSDAAEFLTPRVVCIAAAAASASRGRLSQGALPVLCGLACAPESAPPYAGLLDILDAFTVLPGDAPGGALSADSDDENERISDFVDVLASATDSVEALYAIADLFAPDHDVDRSGRLFGVYDRDGPIGCFLRRTSALFAALPFDAAAALVDAMQAYVAGAADELSPLAASPPRLSDREADAAAFTLSSGAPIARNDVHRALRAAPPRFAAHLEALRRRDYASAAWALHRHFDVSLDAVASATNASAANGQPAASPPGVPGVGGASADARGHQYAALSLAALHFHMGHSRTAVSALDDAVRASQQCGDDFCQTKALAWIARTSASPVQRHLLLRHAGDRLPLAREELLSVITPFTGAPYVAVDLSRKQSFWVEECRREAAVSSSRMRHLRSRIGFPNDNMSVGALLVLAAAWESHASLPTAHAIARMGLRAARRGHRMRPRSSESMGLSLVLTEDEAYAMAAVCSLDSKCGRAKQAIAEIRAVIDSKDSDRIKPDFAADLSSSRPEREILLRCLTWVEFERALRRGETGIAEDLCRTIATYRTPGMECVDLIGGPDAELDSIEARCRLLMALKHFESAAEVADDLCLRAASLSRPERVVEGHRLAAEIRILADAPNQALSHALSAVSLARGLGLEAAHVRSVLTLTDATLRMDGGSTQESIAASSRTLLEVLPRALEGLDMNCRGHARRLQAECLLGRVCLPNSAESEVVPTNCAREARLTGADKTAISGSSGRLRDVASEVVQLLEEAIESYSQAEFRAGLRDCHSILARLYHELGDIAKRNRSSTAFRELVECLAQARKSLR